MVLGLVYVVVSSLFGLQRKGQTKELLSCCPQAFRGGCFVQWQCLLSLPYAIVCPFVLVDFWCFPNSLPGCLALFLSGVSQGSCCCHHDLDSNIRDGVPLSFLLALWQMAPKWWGMVTACSSITADAATIVNQILCFALLPPLWQNLGKAFAEENLDGSNMSVL